LLEEGYSGRQGGHAQLPLGLLHTTAGGVHDFPQGDDDAARAEVGAEAEEVAGVIEGECPTMFDKQERAGDIAEGSGEEGRSVAAEPHGQGHSPVERREGQKLAEPGASSQRSSNARAVKRIAPP
jgi:hypothetical protein